LKTRPSPVNVVLLHSCTHYIIISNNSEFIPQWHEFCHNQGRLKPLAVIHSVLEERQEVLQTEPYLEIVVGGWFQGQTHTVPEILIQEVLKLLEIDASPFLAKVLKATQDSQGDPQVLYSILQANLDNLNNKLAQELRNWAKNTLPKLARSQAKRFASNIANFSNLIRQFPLGNKDCNIEIAITGYEI